MENLEQTLSEEEKQKLLEIEENLGRFPFSALWQDEQAEGFLKFLPIINIIILVIILIVVIIK